MNSADGPGIFLFLLRTTVCNQNINKLILYSTDKNPLDGLQLSQWVSLNKIKNHLQRWSRNRRLNTMFIGKPCTLGTPSLDVRELCTTTVQSVWEQYKQTHSFHNRR